MGKTEIEPIDDTLDNVVDSVLNANQATMPKVSHDGELKIGKIELSCYVLDDGTRVLSNRGINTAFTGTRGGGVTNKTGAQNLPRFLASKAVLPFINNSLMARLTTPIEFQPKSGRTALGYKHGRTI